MHASWKGDRHYSARDQKHFHVVLPLLIRSPPSRFLPRVEKQKIAMFY